MRVGRILAIYFVTRNDRIKKLFWLMSGTFLALLHAVPKGKQGPKTVDERYPRTT